MLADRGVGREARHQRDGHGDAELAFERRRLDELRLEEAHPVDRGQHRLDDAAEPRRHSAREHDLGDLAATERVESSFPYLVVACRASLGQGA